MAIDGRVRVERDGARGRLSILIRHPMETGFRMDPATGRPVAAHFIQTMEVALNGEPIAAVQLGTGISQNPFFVMAISRVETGDVIQVTWRDNRDDSGSVRTTVA